MKTTLQNVAAAALPLFSLAAASLNESCRTQLGKSSVKHIPRTTTTVTNSLAPTITQLTQPIVTTSIGYYQTFTHITHVIDTVTDTTQTDTFSTTTTLYQVETDTVTSTVTTTTTLTDVEYSTSTTEVPTSTGFVNIAGSINNGGNVQRDVAENEERGIDASREHARAVSPKHGLLAMIHPTKIACTVTKAAKPVTVFSTLPASTTTVDFLAYTTSDLVIPTYVTVVPADVNTTLLFSYTSTVTTFVTTYPTTTITTSTTTTDVLPGPTVYDACASGGGNFIGSNFENSGSPYYFMNAGNNGPGVGSDFIIVADGASSAEDCCYSCFQYGNCESFVFREMAQSCFLFTHDGETCAAQSQHPNFLLSRYGSNSPAGYIAGNGNCGYFYSANSDSSPFPVDNPNEGITTQD